MTDVNIWQGAIFHEDAVDDIDANETNKSNQNERKNDTVQNMSKPVDSKSKQLNDNLQPAVHRVKFHCLFTFIFVLSVLLSSFFSL